MFFSMSPSELGIDTSNLPPELRDCTVHELAVYGQLRKVLDLGDADLASFNALLDRSEGKPVQPIQAEVVTRDSEDITLDEAISLAKSVKRKKDE